MDRVEIERTTPDGLTRQEWRFWFDVRTATLWLDYYALSTRPSKRHNFRISHHYGRLNERGSNMTREDAPLPDNISRQAINAMAARIACRKWEDR